MDHGVVEDVVIPLKQKPSWPACGRKRDRQRQRAGQAKHRNRSTRTSPIGWQIPSPPPRTL
eukprot:10364226-Prorocentrum_lima.AAC.1